MSRRLESVGTRVAAFLCNHPRVTISLCLLVTLVALQGSVAAVEGDCSACFETNDNEDVYSGPADK